MRIPSVQGCPFSGPNDAVKIQPDWLCFFVTGSRRPCGLAEQGIFSPTDLTGNVTPTFRRPWREPIRVPLIPPGPICNVMLFFLALTTACKQTHTAHFRRIPQGIRLSYSAVTTSAASFCFKMNSLFKSETDAVHLRGLMWHFFGSSCFRWFGGKNLRPLSANSVFLRFLAKWFLNHV